MSPSARTAAAIAAAVAEALMPEATVVSVLEASTAYLKPWSGMEMLALSLLMKPATTSCFASRYHDKFRQRISCDSREMIPAALAIVRLAKGDPPLAATLGANFGRLHGGRYLRRPERHFTGERGAKSRLGGHGDLPGQPQ